MHEAGGDDLVLSVNNTKPVWSREYGNVAQKDDWETNQVTHAGSTKVQSQHIKLKYTDQVQSYRMFLERYSQICFVEGNKCTPKKTLMK